MTERSLADECGVSRGGFAVAFAGAVIFLYLRLFLLRGVPLAALGDQTLFFSRGERVLHGAVMYRDVFDFLTPGIHLLNAAIFRIVGVHAWVMPAVAMAVVLLLCWMVTRIAAKVVSGPLVLLPALLLLVFDFTNAPEMTHHWYSTLPALAAVGVLMDGAGVRRVALASAWCGVAVLFTQTTGLMTLAAVAVYLLWLGPGTNGGGWKRWVALLLPCVAIVVGVLGYFVYKAGFRTVFFDLMVFAPEFLHGDPNSSRTYLQQFPGFHGVSDAVRNIPILFIYCLVPYGYVFGLVKLWRKRDGVPPLLRDRLVLLNVVGLGLFVSIATGLRLFRLCTVAAPVLIVCAWLVSGQGRWQRIARYGLWVAAGMFAVLLPVHRQMEWHGTLALPIGRTAFTDQMVYRQYRWLGQRTRPGDAFFDADGSAPGLYLALRNPTALELLNDQDPARREDAVAIVAALQSDPPRYVELLRADNSVGLLRAYLREHYRVAETFRFQSDTKAEEDIWELQTGAR